VASTNVLCIDILKPSLIVEWRYSSKSAHLLLLSTVLIWCIIRCVWEKTPFDRCRLRRICPRDLVVRRSCRAWAFTTSSSTTSSTSIELKDCVFRVERWWVIALHWVLSRALRVRLTITLALRVPLMLHLIWIQVVLLADLVAIMNFVQEIGVVDA
jgi:hypothetical protein